MILCVLLICFRNSIFMYFFFFFFLMIRRPPRSTHCISSAASDVYKRQGINAEYMGGLVGEFALFMSALKQVASQQESLQQLSEYINMKENLIVLFKEILGKVVAEGSIDIGVNQIIEQALQEKDKEVTLANWQLAKAEIIEDVYQLLITNISSVILSTIRDNEEKLQIAPKLVNDLLYTCLLYTSPSPRDQA
eukprot:TRINITY_DN589_c0_g1_i15.p1 TRINITY_DN589_c0_g1~~TRINITY_DN589_c0_g1_i15.p1  ORF type:complete len:193 (-),score=58.03 TRINITY_DN589_c0_g1_i15:66-644(-)